MEKFDLNKAKNMSEHQIEAMICEVLAEVCDINADILKEQQKQKRTFKDKCPCCGKTRKVKRNIELFDYPKSFREKAELFRKFARINIAFDKQEERRCEKKKR